MKLGEIGKLSSADALDFAVGRPYERKRHLAPYAHPTAPGPFPESFDFQKNKLQEPLLANNGFTAVPKGYGSGDIVFLPQSDASTSSSAATLPGGQREAPCAIGEDASQVEVPCAIGKDASQAAHPTVQSLLGPNADLPEGLANASLRAPPRMSSADVLCERNPQVSAITGGGWEKTLLSSTPERQTRLCLRRCAVQRRFDTPTKSERNTRWPTAEL